MAKTLRTSSDPDFTTKGATLTFSELDQNFIDIWNEIDDNHYTRAEGDNRYFRQSELLSEASDLPTLRGNIGLADGSADLDLNAIDIDGTEFVDSSRNVSANSIDVEPGSGNAQVNIISQGDTTIQAFSFFEGATERLRFQMRGDGLSSGGQAILGTRFAGGEFRILTGNNQDALWLHDDQSVEMFDTLTINSQLLFDLGQEQNLGENKAVTFAGLTSTDEIVNNHSAGRYNVNLANATGAGTSLAEWRITNPDDSIWVRIGKQASGSDNFTFGAATGSGDNDVAKWVFLHADIEAPGATFSGDVEVQENLFVEGGLFAKEFTVDTTRVFLSSRFGSGGIVGEIVDSTVGSEEIKFVDQDGNEIVPFADNDLLLIQERTGVNSGTVVKRIKRKVVADSQPSNVVSLTTTGVTTGTDVGTVAVGDNAVLDGNTTNGDRDGFIGVDVLDMPIGAFKFYDGVTDFGGGTEVMRVGGMDPGGSFEYDSSLSGDVGIAGKIGGNLAFALTEDEGLIADFKFDENTLTAGDNAKITNESGSFILDANGYNMASGQSAINRIEWFNGTIGDNSDLTGHIYSYYNSTDDLNQLVLRSPSVGVSGSKIFLTSTQLQIVGNEIFVPTNLPTSEPVPAGQMYTQTATQLGGSGTEKVLCVSTGGSPSAPSQPDVCRGGTLLEISWDSVTGADSYDVQRRVDGISFAEWETGITGTTISDSDPVNSPDTDYEYRVRACNANGCSGYSAGSTATTFNTATIC